MGAPLASTLQSPCGIRLLIRKIQTPSTSSCEVSLDRVCHVVQTYSPSPQLTGYRRLSSGGCYKPRRSSPRTHPQRALALAAGSTARMRKSQSIGGLTRAVFQTLEGLSKPTECRSTCRQASFLVRMGWNERTQQTTLKRKLAGQVLGSRFDAGGALVLALMSALGH